MNNAVLADYSSSKMFRFIIDCGALNEQMKEKRKHEKLNKKQNYNDHKNLNILFEREMRQQLHRQTKSTREIHTENRIKTAAKHNQPRAKKKN